VKDLAVCCCFCFRFFVFVLPKFLVSGPIRPVPKIDVYIKIWENFGATFEI